MFQQKLLNKTYNCPGKTFGMRVRKREQVREKE